jgi:mycothiol S-conjugate amidase
MLRLMAVHAHPDDESSKGAATLARYAAEGVHVLVVTCTGGERGDIVNPRLGDPAALMADLPRVRRREMASARAILGVEHAWLGHIDSGMPSGRLPAGCFAAAAVPDAARPLVQLVRRFRPHVLITYDENGGYPHPDHVMCHRVSVHAYVTAGDLDHYPELGLAPWQPLKLYYSKAHNRARAAALHQAMRRAGRGPAYVWTEGAVRPDGEEFTTRVECADWFDTRDRALRAHSTQVDPHGFWFGVPNHVQRTAWPTEEYELAHSRVPVSLPEDDLFAGLRSGRLPGGRLPAADRGRMTA